MSLFPAFDLQRVLVEPWARHPELFGWILAMGFLVSLSCGLVGKFLVLRRMALLGDAMGHSVLPGLVLAYLVAGSRSSPAMFAGALAAAWVTTALVGWLHRQARVRQDTAIGVVFSSLFALGVVLVSLFADRVDLDQDCVLNGELALVPLSPPVMLAGRVLGPPAVVRMAVVCLLTLLLLWAFYKELVVTSFDEVLAASTGLSPGWVQQGLMLWLSVVVVSAFEAVGAVLVVAMLVLPGATASLLCRRLPGRLLLGGMHALLSSVLGLHLGIWWDCSIAAAMVVVGAGLFGLAWLLNPTDGLCRVGWRAWVGAR